MPIEVRELIIKAQVNNANQRQESGSGSGSEEERRTLIEDCVEQVLEILKEREER